MRAKAHSLQKLNRGENGEKIIEVDLLWNWKIRLAQALKLEPDAVLLVYGDADLLRAAQAQ